MVKIYSSSTCASCGQVKERLNEMGVEFEEVDVTQDADGRSNLIAAGFLAVPILEVEGQMYDNINQGLAAIE